MFDLMVFRDEGLMALETAPHLSQDSRGKTQSIYGLPSLMIPCAGYLSAGIFVKES
jgi:hypothetical protein